MKTNERERRVLAHHDGLGHEAEARILVPELGEPVHEVRAEGDRAGHDDGRAHDDLRHENEEDDGPLVEVLAQEGRQRVLVAVVSRSFDVDVLLGRDGPGLRGVELGWDICCHGGELLLLLVVGVLCSWLR
jgi:hypothetical protein